MRSIDHPESQAQIEDECSVCHMPITRYEAKLRGKKGEVFAHLPISTDDTEQRQAADGVSCSVCHQISKEKFGTRESFNGGFVVDPPDAQEPNRVRSLRDREGPDTHYAVVPEGYRPTKATTFASPNCAPPATRSSPQLSAPGGKVIGELPEQMPYPEWLHSDYRNKQSCQDCHMPKIPEVSTITRCSVNCAKAPRATLLSAAISSC